MGMDRARDGKKNGETQDKKMLLLHSRLIKIQLIGWALLFLAVLSMGFYTLFAGNSNARQQTPAPLSASEYHYPALVFSHPDKTAQAKLPYIADDVYDALVDGGMRMQDVMHASGWQCCVSFQPEGSVVFWSDTHDLDVMEIAVFATPTEAKQVATDLVKNSGGFSATSHNLCAFYYRSSIDGEKIARYMKIVNRVCRE